MRKILVLDDNADILQIVTEVLTYEKFKVKGIRLAAELLQAAEDFRPDLILLDLRLTDGHGGELCQVIKSHRQLKHTPVVLFTAYKTAEENLTKYGCDSLIHKPFDLDIMVETVDRLTRKH